VRNNQIFIKADNVTAEEEEEEVVCVVSDITCNIGGGHKK